LNIEAYFEIVRDTKAHIIKVNLRWSQT